MSATILIVEDEESIQELLSYNFEAEGFAVRALDGSEDVVREILADKRPGRDPRCADHHAHRAW